MIGSQSSTIIAVKIFIEQDQIAPVRIGLKQGITTMNGAVIATILQENAHQPMGYSTPN